MVAIGISTKPKWYCFGDCSKAKDLEIGPNVSQGFACLSFGHFSGSNGLSESVNCSLESMAFNRSGIIPSYYQTLVRNTGSGYGK